MKSASFRPSIILSGAIAVLLAAPAAKAAPLYWDGGTINIGTTGNGVSLGTAGNWDTVLTNWDQGNNLAHVAWNNANLDTAFFGGTAATVTLAAPITVGGLDFFSNSGYTIAASTQGLTFGAANNTIRFNAVSGTTTTATVTGTVTSVAGGNLSLSSVNPSNTGTMTFSGASAGGWSGATNIAAGMILASDSTGGVNQVLNNTSAINLNGGTLVFKRSGITNTNLVADSAAITVNGGGTLAQQNNDAGNVNAIETVGAVTVNSGQFNFVITNGGSSGSTVRFNGLTLGSTATVTFNGNATNTWVNLNGGTAPANTTAGQIIGPWATFGAPPGLNTFVGTQTDYAVYGGGNGTVAGANIAASAQSAWSTDFTTGTGTLNNTLANAGGTAVDGTLTANRNINSLRVNSSTAGLAAVDFATNDTITVTGSSFANGDVVSFGGTAPGGLTTGQTYYVVGVSGATFSVAATSGGTKIDLTSAGTGPNITGGISLGTSNLGTTGILNAGASGLAIGSNGGVITLPTTTAGNLYVTPGNGAQINILAPITDNTATGVLTLVKTGTAALNLTGNNTFTGGLVNNAGTTTLSGTNTFGSGAVTLNGGAVTFSTIASWGGANRNVNFNGGPSTLTSSADAYSGGVLTVNSGAVGIIAGQGATFASATGSGTLIYANTTTAKTLNIGNASGFTGTLQARMGGATNAAPVVQFSSLSDTAGSALQIGGGSGDSAQTGSFTFNGSASLTFNNRRIEILPRTTSNWGANAILVNNSATANIWTINTDLSYLTDQSRNLTLSGTNTGNNAFNGVIGNGNVGGTVNLVKSAAGTWVLGGANTYTGTTTVSGGFLILNNLNAIANSSAVTVSSGFTLQANNAGTYANTAPVTLTGAGTNTGATNLAGALHFGNGGAVATVWNAPTTLGAANTRITSFGVTMAQTLGGAIGGTGPLELSSRGGSSTTHTAVWTLGAASNYTGTTAIVNNDGLKDITVKLGVNNALPITTSVNLAAVTGSATAVFATLDLNGKDQELIGLTDTGGTSTLAGGSSNKRVINSSATLSTLKINNAAAVTYGTTGTRINAGTIGGTTAAGVAANNLALIKSGAGALTLAGANTYTGGTTITGGTLTASTSNSALGTGTVTLDPGAVRLLVTDGLSIANNIIINAAAGLGGRGMIENTSTGNATLSGGTITINAAPGLGGHFASAAGGSLTIADPINSSVPINSRVGTVIFSGGGTYSDLAAFAGTVKLGASNGLSTAATLSIGNATAASFDLAGFDQTLVGITKSGSAATVGNSSTTSDSLLTTTGTSTFAGVIQNVLGSGSRKVALAVNGGSLTLSGANTYTGTTSVTAGELVVTGSLSGTASVDVGNGTNAAKFSGNGAITTGAVTIANNATLAPGLSAAGLTIGTGTASILALQSGSTFELSIANNQAGAAALGDYAKLTLGAGVATTIAGQIVTTGVTSVDTGDLFTIMLNGGSAVSGTFSNTTANLVSGSTYTFTSGGQAWLINYAYTAGSTTAEGINAADFAAVTGGTNVALLAVPEPGALVSLLGGFVTLLGFQRRRRA